MPEPETILLGVIFGTFGTMFPALAYTRWGLLTAGAVLLTVLLVAIVFGYPAYRQFEEGGHPGI